MNENFIESVKSQDLNRVRISLCNSLSKDPTGKTFKEMYEYASEKLPNLMEENKDLRFEVPPVENWDEHFLDKVAFSLETNFSLEKLALYQEVINVVLQDKIIKIENKETEDNENSQNVKIKSFGILIGGATLSIIALSQGLTALTISCAGIGVAIMIFGIYFYIKNRRV